MLYFIVNTMIILLHKNVWLFILISVIYKYLHLTKYLNVFDAHMQNIVLMATC